ncbi:GNAT family N-acetyltransferase [Streptomyces nanshensis]|uniref:GNAT family N-acetyltransferase n=1 Tax=Streptomyces nanshensis TaxID=518642 RepID=UPI0014960FE3|nr:GNAT family N-acetyltransferase [Streptomyces nanshensis]
MAPLGDDAPHRHSPAGISQTASHAADELGVSRASSQEWLQVEEWAAEEQWNPGLGDTACFHPTDPEGFFLGRRGGSPVSAVSVVNYSGDFAFLGYYLVHRDLRGTGLGKATWDAAVLHAGERTVGLDAVLEQEPTYRRSGFVPDYRTGRYGGRLTARGAAPSPSVVPVTPEHFEALAAYDEQCFPAPRRGFLERWLNAPGHRARVFLDGEGDPAGYGVIRQARSGHRVGPLFADTPEAADALFDALTAHLSQDDEVYVDIPESHEAAVAIATSRGLELGFESVRMYKGTPPAVSSERVFGVTSLELG